MKNYGAQTHFFYSYTNNLIINVNTRYFCEDIKDYVEKRFDVLYFEVQRHLVTEKGKID